jgi:hypothetical protein
MRENLKIEAGDGGDTVTTDQQGRVNPDERIDEAGPRQGRCELPATLDEKSRDAALTQRCERSGKIDAAPSISADFYDHDTAVEERLPPGSFGRRKSYDPGRHLFGIGNQAGIRAYGEMSVDDDPYRRPFAQSRQSAGQLRIIGGYCAASHHDRIMRRAQGVSAIACRGPGDPAAFVASRGDTAVKRSGEL